MTHFRKSLIATLISAILAPTAFAGEEQVGVNVYSAIYGVDTSGTPHQVTGVTAEPYQGAPYTVIYADDNQGTMIDTANPTKDTANVVVMDGGMGSTTSSSTYVQINGGRNNLTVSGAGITASGNTMLDGNLDVIGSAGMHNANILNNATVGNKLTVQGETSLGDTVIGGRLTIAAPAEIYGHATVHNSMTVEGGTNLNTLSNTGAFDQTGNTAINITGNGSTTIGNIHSNTTVGGALNVAADADLQSNLQVRGTAQTSGVLNQGALVQNGTAAINTVGTGPTTIGNVHSATTVGGALNVAGPTQMASDLLVDGQTKLGANLTVGGTTSTNGLTNAGALTQAGATSINATGAAATRIGNAASATEIGGALTVAGPATMASDLLVDGNAKLGANLTVAGATATAGLTNTGALMQTGATSINTSGDASTAIGNIAASSSMVARGGNAVVSVANNAAVLGLTDGASFVASQSGAAMTGAGKLASNGTTGKATGTAGGVHVFNAAQSVAPNATINNALAGFNYNNKISGNTFIDGNVAINGTLSYVSSNSATTTVIGANAGTSVLSDAKQGTVGGTSIVMRGSDGATESKASLTLTNGIGNTHGMEVYEDRAVFSGGANSTTMTLNDNGVTFTTVETGGPARVTGVADGRSAFDAVNYRQLKNVAEGVASTTAIANIPQLESGKSFSVGAGLGRFDGNTALAIGGSYRVAPNAVVRASVGSSMGSGSNTVLGIGAAMSW